MKQNEFFDNNSNLYGIRKPMNYDYFFIDIIKRHSRSNNCELLDIGGGGGVFTNLCKENFQNTKLCIVDPSHKLLHKENIQNIKYVVGKLPSPLNLNFNEKFSYIHIKEVLHHITGRSVKESKNLVRLSLVNIQKHLKKDGFVLIHELYYESWIISTLTRSLIFYMLRIQNCLKIKIPAKEFLLGLEVCFYTRNELKTLFNNVGLQIIDYYEEPMYFGTDKVKNKLFLKNWGHACYILQRTNI